MMDVERLKNAARVSVVIMAVVLLIALPLNQMSPITFQSSVFHNAEAADSGSMEIISVAMNREVLDEMDKDNETTKETIQPLIRFDNITEDINSDIVADLGDKYLVIKKPSSDHLHLFLEDLYMERSIRILIEGSTRAMDSRDVGRVNQGHSFVSDPVFREIINQKIDPKSGDEITETTKDYGYDLIYEMIITSNQDNSTGLYSTEYRLQLDNVYAHILIEDENYYYIGLKRPKEVYDRILVVDAGHGGKDAGALSTDKQTYEKNINLNILLLLKELLDDENIKVYYTRLQDDKIFLRPRVQLANAVDCDFFISIHCNASVSKSPNGTEMLYYDVVSKNISIKALADIFSEELSAVTTLQNRGVVKQREGDIFILENSLVPALIIEAAYMTNSNDLTYLKNLDNQKLIAKGIYRGILRAYDELK